MKAQTDTAKDSHGWIGSETINTRFGNFEFKNGQDLFRQKPHERWRFCPRGDQRCARIV